MDTAPVTKKPSGKVASPYSAARHNWFWSAIGLVVAMAGTVVATRVLGPGRFSEYATALSIVALINLLADAGANSGVVRFMGVAREKGARGTFYVEMQRRRIWVCLAVAAGVVLGVPPYLRNTPFFSLAGDLWFVVAIAVIAISQLLRNLGHYALLSMFEHRVALARQTLFAVGKSLVIAGVAILGGQTRWLVVALAVVSIGEAWVAHASVWSRIRNERAGLEPGFCRAAQSFGLFNLFDKTCANLGSGTFLLLIMGQQRNKIELAHLALGADLVGKIVSLAVMPIGNLVSPYLANVSDAGAPQSRAIGRIARVYSLLLGTTAVAALLLLPWVLPLIYGEAYRLALGVTMTLLLGTLTENWLRGFVSPALLRNGRNRPLVVANVVQALAMVATTFATRNLDIATAVLLIAGARSLGTLLCIPALAEIVALRVLAKSVAVMGAAIALGLLFCWGRPLLHLDQPVWLAVALLAPIAYILVLGWVIRDDLDLQGMLFKLHGGRLKIFSKA